MSEILNEPISTITCSYKEPKWSGICSEFEYGLDVLKNGVIIENLKLTDKPFYIIGRYKTCDFIFEHPSLSRFHSILQYCSHENDEGKEKGWYLMDLDSTHGTLLNKKRIPSHTFVRIHTGHVIKFGGSTRLYVVTGPEEDKEELSKYTWTELMEMKNKRNQKVADASGYLPSDDSKDLGGCMWGMNESFENEENHGELNMDGKLKHEDLYKDDPKKVIKQFFEKEGFDESPQYEFSKVGFNKNICKLELPVFGENGEKIVVEVSGSDKKKDLITRCAMESCRILDEMDELYKPGGLGRRQKKDNKYYEAKDYYSSDEDDFYDRTGQIEAKRIQRMRRFGVACDVVEEAKDVKIEAKNSDSVLVKFNRLEEINDEILSIEEQLEEACKAMDAGDNSTELDEIEKYIESIQSGTISKKIRLKLRAQIFELTREENLLRKQLKLSIPVTASMRKSLYQCKERPDKSEETNKSNDDIINTKIECAKIEIKIPIAKNPVPAKVLPRPDEDTIENESDDEEDDEPIDESNSSHSKIDDGSKRKSNDEGTDSSAKRSKLSFDEEETDECSDWVPPIGQTGDGKTSLNEKLGY